MGGIQLKFLITEWKVTLLEWFEAVMYDFRCLALNQTVLPYFFFFFSKMSCFAFYFIITLHFSVVLFPQIVCEKPYQIKIFFIVNDRKPIQISLNKKKKKCIAGVLGFVEECEDMNVLGPQEPLGNTPAKLALSDLCISLCIYISCLTLHFVILCFAVPKELHILAPDFVYLSSTIRKKQSLMVTFPKSSEKSHEWLKLGEMPALGGYIERQGTVMSQLR